MSRLEHNYSEIAEHFNLQTIKSLHYYYDCILTYKIKNNYLNCEMMTSLFYERQVTYSLRNFRKIHENTQSSNVGFYSSINRLRRLWNTLPQSVLDSANLALYKRSVRSLSLQF